MNSGNEKMNKFFTHARFIAIFMICYDFVVANAAYFLALLIRFDLHYSAIPVEYFSAWQKFTLIYALICVVIYYFMKLYKIIWRFASYRDLFMTIVASLIVFAVQIIGISLIHSMPASYFIIGFLIQFTLTVVIRFAYRFVLFIQHSLRRRDNSIKRRVMIIGAGAAGQMLCRDIMSSSEVDSVVCFIDDNPNKWNRYVEGIKVVGGRDDILTAVKDYLVERIYLALPSADVQDKKELITICSESGCELRQVPSSYVTQSDTNKATAVELKDVNIEDLLGRDPVKVNMDEVFNYIHGKTVMVTGGGGSIGSELCRQVAKHSPKTLIIFDVYENNAYSIQLELKHNYPDLDLVTLIGSVRDSARLHQVFSKYRPDIVYHAAAHKHVPLMEDSPCESIKNNVLGTYKTAYAAMTNGCRRFVLVSTDKAVNPTNIMGASKRLCEMIIQSYDRKIKAGKGKEIPFIGAHDALLAKHNCEVGSCEPATEFVAVRFGNVLGSNGSVVPLFEKQIKEGGPVTVTHPDIIRYFMTVPEAVSLIMQAGVYAKGGEIFVLDMGEPVKIDTMARNLIKLSGLRPDVDIKIEYTGLRPGEKLYEEKLMAEEGMSKTDNDLIFIGHPIDFDEDKLIEGIPKLMETANNNREDMIRKLVNEFVPTYHYETKS